MSLLAVALIEVNVDSRVSASRAYLFDEPTETSERIRNYTGGLGEATACMAELGILRCSFEQQLEATRLVLVGNSLTFSNPTPFEVIEASAPGEPALGPSCSSATGAAAPAVRIHWLSEQVERALTASICEDIAATMATAATFVRTALDGLGALTTTYDGGRRPRRVLLRGERVDRQ